MTIKILGKELGSWFLNGKKLEEVWYGGKKVRPLNNSKPIWRMHDWELWFRVNVKDPNEPFKIAVNGYGGTSYDWDISIDWQIPVRYQGSKSKIPIQLSMSVGKHYVKITPHNWAVAGWARCLGNWWMTNYWNWYKNKLEFWLERLPWYAFMQDETEVGDYFLSYAWSLCSSLTSMPTGFNLPQGITSVGNKFLYYAWVACTSLTFMPAGFNIPQGITSVGNEFLSLTWYNCTSLTSMPAGFNIPQGITSVGNSFLSGAWRGCSSLTSMPAGFNIPQGITRIGNSFLSGAWVGCSSLTSNSPAESLNFPNISSYYYWNNCFGWSCPITPDTPTPWSSVMIRRNP